MHTLCKIKRLSFCSLLLCLPLYAWAYPSEDTSAYKKFTTSIKLNYTYANFQNFYRYNTFMNGLPFPTHHYSSYGMKAVGLAFKNNKNLNSHEVEINSMGFTTSTGPGKRNSDGEELTVRYQFNYSLCKKPDAFIYPYAGISAMLGFVVESSKYKDVWYESKRSERLFAGSVDLVPGIQIHISNRFYLDLSIPLSIYRTSEVTYRSQTGFFPPTIDRLGYYEWLATFKSNYYQARIGLGVNLNAPDNLSSTETFHKTIKFNYNLVRTNIREDHHSTTFHNFYPAITFQHKKLLNLVHEIELRNIDGENRHVGNSFRSYFLFSSRYQLNFFPWSKPRFLSPYAGLSFLVTYNESKIYPNGVLYKLSNLDYANAFVPGVQINSAKKIYFDLSIPINFFIAGKVAESYRRTDLSLNRTYGMFFPENRGWTVRLGIGLKI